MLKLYYLVLWRDAHDTESESKKDCGNPKLSNFTNIQEKQINSMNMSIHHLNSLPDSHGMVPGNIP